MRTALREGWISLLKVHLIKKERRIENALLSFEGLAVKVVTKTNHLVGDEFHLHDPERLVVIRRNPWKTFKPRWDTITRVEFCYRSPVSSAALTGKELLRRLRCRSGSADTTEHRKPESAPRTHF